MLTRACMVLLTMHCLNVVAQTAEEAPDAALAEQASLPALMSLTQVLALSDSSHPAVLKQSAELQARRANILSAGLDQRWHAELIIDARAANQLNDGDRLKNDSRADFTISKLLWDFGRSAAELDVATLSTQSAEIRLHYAERLQRINIMRQYFAVLAADYQFAADNESMTLAFFPFDRAQERNERFDSVSELEVLQKRQVYLAELSKRNQSIRRQRASRFQLALAMGLPQAKPDGLIEPDLSAYARELPDFDELLERVLATSPLIKQKQAELTALEAERALVGVSENPEINLRLSAASYEQRHRLRDRSRAIIELRIPLIKGKLRDVETANLAAQLTAKEAEMSLLDYQVREQVLSWVQRLETLNQEIEQNVQNIESAERALDKARLLYEMEVSALIGRTQADMARLLWQDASIRFERALIWEQLDAVLAAPTVEFEQ